MTSRASLQQARRIVVKIGTRSLLGENLSQGKQRDLARQIQALRDDGKELVLVSSGAIALGRKRLGLHGRPTRMDQLQACAAAGQSLLMRSFEEAFEAYGAHVSQVLLTHADLSSRDRYLNARSAINALLELSSVPIINENDTVAVDEIRFGDNDQLAAMVANLVGADLLILLTDVSGILDDKGNTVPVATSAEDVARWIKPSDNDVSRGGMESKVRACERAALRGLPVVIASAHEPDVLCKVAAGASVGTLFPPPSDVLPARKHWIAFTLKSHGTLVVDQGATKALHRGASLLPAGIQSCEGSFSPFDAVSICDVNGKEIARGLCRYSSEEVGQLLGLRTENITEAIGRYRGDEVVHRDDMVSFT